MRPSGRGVMIRRRKEGRGSEEGRERIRREEGKERTCAGHPWIENGHNPDENHVSSTSSSCSSTNFLPANLTSARACASSRLRPETQNSPLRRCGHEVSTRSTG